MSLKSLESHFHEEEAMKISEASHSYITVVKDGIKVALALAILGVGMEGYYDLKFRKEHPEIAHTLDSMKKSYDAVRKATKEHPEGL